MVRRRRGRRERQFRERRRRQVPRVHVVIRTVHLGRQLTENSRLLPGIVILAALGANIYWVSLVVTLRELLAEGAEELLAA